MKDINKRGEGSTDIMWETIVLLIIGVLAVVILAYSITRQADSIANNEQTLAKQLALVIDSAKPGMEIAVGKYKTIDVYEISKEGSKIRVKLRTSSTGYSYRTFSSYDFKIDKVNGQWVIKII